MHVCTVQREIGQLATSMFTEFIPLADVGGARDTRPPAPNFFIFMQFSGKIGQIIGWCPLWGWRTPLGIPGSGTAFSCSVFSSHSGWILRDCVKKNNLLAHWSICGSIFPPVQKYFFGHQNFVYYICKNKVHKIRMSNCMSKYLCNAIY